MSRVTSLEMSPDLTSSTSTSSSFSITTNSDCEKLTVATVTRIQAEWSRVEFHVCVCGGLSRFCIWAEGLCVVVW